MTSAFCASLGLRLCVALPWARNRDELVRAVVSRNGRNQVIRRAPTHRKPDRKGFRLQGVRSSKRSAKPTSSVLELCTPQRHFSAAS